MSWLFRHFPFLALAKTTKSRALPRPQHTSTVRTAKHIPRATSYTKRPATYTQRITASYTPRTQQKTTQAPKQSLVLRYAAYINKKLQNKKEKHFETLVELLVDAHVKAYQNKQQQLQAEARKQAVTLYINSVTISPQTPPVLPLLAKTAAIQLPKTRKKPGRKRRMALLLPGHNEELILATTIASAVAAGQSLRDIFVVDDNSSDNTRAEALRMLPQTNVLTVPRSGKALAVSTAIQHFSIPQLYEWVHVADADSVFGKDYFKIYRASLHNSKYVVAVGFVQSMRGNWISTYRALSYSYGQHIIRRLQSLVGMITVFPGPTTSFRTDILADLDFTTSSLTEDFDLTIQVHRKKLGKILYIPNAISYTQDPQTLRDFCKQTSRWFRGYFQGIKKYRVGTKLQAIDVGIGYQLFETCLYFAQLFVFVPLVIYYTNNWLIIPIIIASDFVVMSLIAVFSGMLAKRLSVVGALPYFYFLRTIELAIFVISFVEIYILGKFNAKSKKGWATEGRRYQLHPSALQDITK